MTRVLMMLAVLFLAGACDPQSRDDDINLVSVTEETLKEHSADNPYVAEVTRNGTIYEVAPGVPTSLIDVRAPTETPLRTTAGRYAGTGSGVLVGTLNDLGVRDYGFPENAENGPVAEVKCDKKVPGQVSLCNCTGKRDCDDMNTAGLCAGGSNKSATCGKDAAGKWGCTCMKKGG